MRVLFRHAVCEVDMFIIGAAAAGAGAGRSAAELNDSLPAAERYLPPKL